MTLWDKLDEIRKEHVEQELKLSFITIIIE